MAAPVIVTPIVDEASYWWPPRLIESAWLEHAPFACWLVRNARPGRVVELGTHSGFSFFTMAEAARRLGLSTRLSAVDSWKGDDQAGFYSEDIYQSVLEISQRDFPDSTELVRGFFSDVVDRFDDGSVDLLHIDGRHGYDDVWQDWNSYRPKLSKRGVAIFHDTYEFMEGFEVHRFWDEVAKQYPSFRFEHGHGLGVLAVGDDVPPAVRDFLAAANADPDRVRGAYETLGSAVSSAWLQRDALRQHADALVARVAELDAELAAAHRGGESLAEELRAVYASTSWRVTAPVRRIRRLGRRAPLSGE